MRFVKKVVTIYAVQWYPSMLEPPADSPLAHVRPYPIARPTDDPERKCLICGETMAKHGWVDIGGPICAWDYVYFTAAGEPTTRTKRAFEAEYEPW